MTTSGSAEGAQLTPVVEAYRLGKYDNFPGCVIGKVKRQLQKLIVWVSMTTLLASQERLAHNLLQKLIVWVSMTTSGSAEGAQLTPVVEAYRLGKYDN